ncbi:MAG: phosphatase PAP2 family protein [Planctomycetota bacterium]
MTYRRNGILLRIMCAGLVLAAGCANTSPLVPDINTHACCESKSPQQEFDKSLTNKTESASQEPLWLKSAKADLTKWPDRLIKDSKDSFLRTDNMTTLLLAGGISIAMHNSDADKNIAEHFEEHQSLHNFWDESLNVIGHPATHFAATGLWYGLSAEDQDDLNKERASTMITALSVTWLATMGLKIARNNESPNGKDWAWPSGHTSSSFAVASVLDEFYGPKVGIPAYALASLVAYRMMDTSDHWASDIVFGATLGWIVGHTIAGKHKKLELAGFDVLPYMGTSDEPVIGVSLVKKF